MMFLVQGRTGGTMPYARRDDLSLYYERAGGGDPPMVFVPGWCCDAEFFQPQFDHFAAGHAVLAYDPRGCGRSDLPEHGYELTNLADDLAWLMAETGLTGAVVVGHSLGGMVAIELAGRHPDMVVAVIADDPGPIDPLPETRRVYDDFAAGMAGPDGERIRRDWVKAGVGGTDGADLRRWIVETMCGTPLPVAAAMIGGAMAWDGVAALTRCRVPTLILRSAVGGSNEPARLLAHKPDLRFGLTVGTGHFHQLDAADQVNPMMERFLRSEGIVSPARRRGDTAATAAAR
jgi:pimeloyl-ACP methyl ester carboxylesterase